MRQLLLLLSVLPFAVLATTGRVAQQVLDLGKSGAKPVEVHLFDRVERSAAMERLWSGELKSATALRMAVGGPLSTKMSAPAFVSINVPYEGGSLILDLIRSEVSTDDFKVSTSSGQSFGEVQGVHYRGMVRGVQGSLVALSVFPNEVMALISAGPDQWELGRLGGDPGGHHILFKERDRRKVTHPNCDALDDGGAYHPDELRTTGADRTLKCVRYYWEVNYDIYQNKGSVVLATNYVTGLFNQSAVLFANDGIDVTLSEVFVWDTPSPYVQTTTSALLNQFGITRTSFNGDMAHLLGYVGSGGIAWLNTLCNSQTRLRMAYSDINSTYSNVPAYSWSVEVVTHEQGHNLGSRHTHACAWNGNSTAIDGCGPAAGYTEGSCAQGPIPTSAVGGTIMSYCHLISAGIRFQNGFGPQPTTVIVNAVNAASCLNACGTSCDPPGNLVATGITTTAANLSWSAIGATSYTLRWKPVSSGIWTTVTGLTGNTYALSGLTQSTAYEFQVMSICSASSSAFSLSYTFTTTTPCPDSLEPNNSLATAAVINLPANISALIASSSDIDYYRFTLTATSTINISLSNLAGDYDLRLLDNAGAQLAISQNGGTASESISYPNAVAGNYHVHVFGYSGAFSATQCYSLNVSAFVPQGCNAPETPAFSNITWSTTTVTWLPVQGVSTFDLRWKPSSSSTWTVVLGISGTSHPLTGLSPTTMYDVEVRSVCTGTQGSTSAYSSTGSFTTLAAPCEVAPPILLAARVMLDGPYRAAAGLMIDSLRVHGLIPLQEPYTALGFTLSGSATTTLSVFNVVDSNAIVDWVLVELRSVATPTNVVEVRAGLLQRDGDVVGMDGTSALGFCSNAGTYLVAVRHRNHLGVMTATGRALSATVLVVDLSLPGTATYGTSARRGSTAPMTLWAGNSSGDAEVKYTGNSSDRDLVLSAIGGSIPTNTVAGYRIEDCNLDGLVKYTGPDSDRDVILGSIGGVIPTNTVQQQLP